MREEKIYKIEVHVAGICFKEDKVLVVKRSTLRRLYPNLWECGGGQVNAGEDFEEAIKRQLKEEIGVIVDVIRTAGVYEILVPDTEQKKIPGVIFICKLKGYVNDESPQISKEHVKWQWQSIDRLEELEFIPSVKERIERAYRLFYKGTI